MYDWSSFLPNLIIAGIQGLILAIILKFWIDKLTENKYKSKARKYLIEFYNSIKDEDSEMVSEIIDFMDNNISEYFQKFIRMKIERKKGKTNTHYHYDLNSIKYIVKVSPILSLVLILDRQNNKSFKFEPKTIKDQADPSVKEEFLKYLDNKFIENKIFRDWRSHFSYYKNKFKNYFRRLKFYGKRRNTTESI